MTDVVITGFGATTPLGADAPSTWQGLVEGRNGVHTLDHEWAEGLPVTFAAEVVDAVSYTHLTLPTICSV